MKTNATQLAAARRAIEAIAVREGISVEEVRRGPGVKFCVSDFRQSQEWCWKAGRILA